MESLLLLIGALASLVIFVVGLPLLALSVALWETWWLLPLWDWSIVAIGGPAITFGQLLCLQVMVSAFLPRFQVLPKEEKPDAGLMRLAVSIVSPMFAYYAIVIYRWWVA